MKDKKKVSDILKEYKSLYDSGVIDEKEYMEFLKKSITN